MSQERIVYGSIVFVLALVLFFPAAGVSIAQDSDSVPARRLTCASEPGERQHCTADTTAGVALVRETGTTPCILGNNWGYDAQGIWVSDGCSAEFTLGKLESTEDDDRFLGKFEPYGRFLAHVAMFDDEAVVQDNASWLGMRFSTGEDVKFFAGLELGVNIIGGPQFNAGASTESGFLRIEQTSPQVFGNRLGYMGVDFGQGGKLTLGKQKSVHYDIAGYTTDRWNVFGGQASLAYPSGSDGGTSGTGRINQALTYRNSALEVLEFGLQTQFRNADNYDTDNVDRLIADDFRTRYVIVGTEFHLAKNGFLYAEARIDDSIDADGRDQPSILTVGFHYGFSWKSLRLPEM